MVIGMTNQSTLMLSILDTVVCGSIPDSSPGRFRAVIEATEGSGSAPVNGIVLGCWDVGCMGEG